MRDNSEGMPEIIKTYTENGNHFVVVGKTIDGINKSFAFWISEKAFVLINKVLSFYPFDKLLKDRYKYFFAGCIRKDSKKNTQYTDFRIEQGKNGKQFEFEVELQFLKNIIWFSELKDFEQVKHLKEIF
ncbi:MAG: hypothetical protein JXR81_11635 [Candidatus Goldbacteria bacterium]|nr:hypothetical protein [Candidatus Goldiibacteriota bacterium]